MTTFTIIEPPRTRAGYTYLGYEKKRIQIRIQNGHRNLCYYYSFSYVICNKYDFKKVYAEERKTYLSFYYVDFINKNRILKRTANTVPGFLRNSAPVWARGQDSFLVILGPRVQGDEKSVLTSRPERCAVSQKSGNGLCRYNTQITVPVMFPYLASISDCGCTKGSSFCLLWKDTEKLRSALFWKSFPLLF